MGKLEHLVRLQQGPDAATADMALARVSVDKFMVEALRDLGELQRAMHDRIQGIEEVLEGLEIPDHTEGLEALHGEVRSTHAMQLQALRDQVASVVAAVRGIKIPEPPEARDVDLSPLLAAIREIRLEPGVERPLAWEAEIERDRFGLLKRVKFKAVRDE